MKSVKLERHDWLKNRMKDLGKTGQGLAKALNVNKARVSEIIGGRRGVRADEVIAIAAYLQLSEQEVVARLSGAEMKLGAGDLSSEPLGGGQNLARTVDMQPPATMPLDMPVYGSAVGGQDASFEMNGDIVDRVRRPPGLAAASNAFALYVVGFSMSPRYDEGDLIFIHPGKPPVIGCDVVVELLANDGFERNKALLKTYRGKSATHLLLTQLNPPLQIDIRLEEVKQILRVMRTNELLGV